MPSDTYELGSMAPSKVATLSSIERSCHIGRVLLSPAVDLVPKNVFVGMTMPFIESKSKHRHGLCNRRGRI